MAWVKKFVHDQFSRDPGKRYFTARQMFQWQDAEKTGVRVDTEVCELTDVANELFIVLRFIVRFCWNLRSQEAQPITDTNDESPLTTLSLQRITTHHLGDVPELCRLSSEQIRFLEEHWKEVLDGLQQAAEEYLKHASSAGGWSDEDFPERIYMTGEYHIADLRGQQNHSYSAMLHFRRQPWAAQMNQEDLDDVGVDVRFEFDDTQRWSFEGFNQMVL